MIYRVYFIVVFIFFFAIEQQRNLAWPSVITLWQNHIVQSRNLLYCILLCSSIGEDFIFFLYCMSLNFALFLLISLFFVVVFRLLCAVCDVYNKWKIIDLFSSFFLQKRSFFSKNKVETLIFEVQSKESNPDLLCIITTCYLADAPSWLLDQQSSTRCLP